MMNKSEKIFSGMPSRSGMTSVETPKGVIVPMVTPFNEDLSVDQEAVEKIVETFLETNVAPFVLGTTGESVSIANVQKMMLVKAVVDYVNKRQKVFAGISGNCLKESIDQAKAYADIGVEVMVAHLPFYYPLSSGQMLQYFEQLADSIPCPLILYNIPNTVKQSIPLEVAERLSYHPNIAGIKDSERGIERIDKSLRLWKQRTDFAYFLGWAAQSAYALKKGADGIVPSTGNVSPKLYSDLYAMAIQGKSLEAENLQQMTNRISEIYQKDKNLSQSIPALKILMSVHGLCKPFVMPPMYALDMREQGRIKANMEAELNHKVLN